MIKMERGKERQPTAGDIERPVRIEKPYPALFRDAASEAEIVRLRIPLSTCARAR